MSALGGLAWQWIDPSKSIWVAISVLVVTCPCALSLSAPSALLAAAGAMGKKGLLVRRLDAIESLAGVEQVFFDKTGTLTEGHLSLVRVVGVKGELPLDDEGFAFARSLACYSQHPLSRSLSAAGPGDAMPIHPLTDVVELAG